MPLLFDGIRRHDEFKQAAIMVPDEVSLKPTGVKPTAPEEETDPAIIREVWVKATSGERVGEWERQIAVDSYRVRKLVAHWVETGALEAAG